MNVMVLEAKPSPRNRRKPLSRVERRAKRLPTIPVTGDAEQRQIDWEQAAHMLAKEAFPDEGKSAAELPGGQHLLRQILMPLAERIAQVQKSIDAKRGNDGRRPNWHYAMLLLKPRLLAAITATIALRAITPEADDSEGPTFAVLAREIAAAVRTAVKYHEWLKKQREDDKPDDVVRRLGKRPSTMTPRAWARWERRFASVVSQPWPESDDLTLGGNLLALLLQTHRFKKVKVRVPGSDYTHKAILQLSDDTRAQLSDDLSARAEAAMPRLLPMLIPPRNWQCNTDDGKAQGGYLTLPQALVRASVNGRMLCAASVVSALDLEALNIIQKTPWRINRRVLGVLTEAWRRHRPELHLPDCRPETLMPERFPDDVWAAMDEESRQQHKVSLRRAHQARLMHRRRKVWEQELLDKLVVARAMANETLIYYPHNRDFRMRVYPIPVAGPHPQSDDIGKALIEFGEGVPLGETG